MLSRRPFLLLALAAVLAFSGCREAKITSYRVLKEAPPSAAVHATSLDPHSDPHAGLGIPPVNGGSMPAASGPVDMASTPVPTAAGDALAWTAPEHWQARAGSPMRKGTYLIAGEDGQSAELAITAFPGDVGGNLANVNRWRQQLQLAPISPAELGSTLTHVHAGGLHIDIVELLGPASTDGKPRQRVLGAIVPFNGATWFFKLTGPDALVAREKNAFYAFVQTIRPAR